jgi:diguanylate cyclase (GGDEF)-like protein
MKATKAKVLACHGASPNDDHFISKLDELISADGNIVCQAVIEIFVDVEFSPARAKQCWDNLLAHRSEISLALGRPINLVAVMCDYFAEEDDIIFDPKLVEIAEYENMILQSTHDNLTGLYNRQYFTHALAQHVALAKRNQNDLSILFIDVDDFKEVNDLYGHEAGDEALRQLSKVISEAVRQSDIAARYGGEEFIVLLPFTNSIEALILAERMRANVEKCQLDVDGKVFSITISGGIASYPVNTQNAETLISLADSALYRAKGAGKNTISLFKEDNRRFVRIDLRKTVHVKELGFSQIDAFLGIGKDICVGGILFENSRSLAIGTKVQISVPIGNEGPVLLIGTVVRVEILASDRYDIGVVIAFKEMEKLAKNEISRFLMSQTCKDSPLLSL